MAAFAENGGAPDAPALSAERVKELKAACTQLIKRSILTLSAVPDNERRFQRGPGCSLPEAAPEQVEIDFEELLRVSRGETSRKAYYFRPTPQDLSRYLEVLAWLNWLWRQAGAAQEVKLLFARAHGVPWWKLSQRFGKSEDTLKRWAGAAIEALTARYWRDIDRLS
jgi:hypothetical protein